MANVNDRFVLVALLGQAASYGEEDVDVGEVGVTYFVKVHRSGRNWMARDDGGRGIGGVPDNELEDTTIWQPA